MITKFKLFESSIAHELVDDLSDDTIESVYDDKYKITAREICSDYGPNYIWDNIDDDKYKDEYIQDQIDNAELDNFSESDLKEWIENNLSSTKKDKIIEIYKENNDLDEELEYDDVMLDELTEEELIEVIAEDGDEEDFYKEQFEDRYGESDTKDLVSELYNMDNGRELYDALYYYIDDDELIKNFKNDEDFEYKKEYVEDYIDKDTSLQREILKNNPSAVISLAELFTTSIYENIANEYEFQKLYIQKYVEGEGDTEYFMENDEELHQAIAEALKFLYDNFELNPDIEQENKKDMWLAKSAKYNL